MRSFQLKVRDNSLFKSSTRVIVIAALAVLWSTGNGGAATVKQKQFSSPEEASKALINAIRGHDSQELLAIFGPSGKDLIFSGDEVEDRAARARFEKAYDEMNQLERKDDKRVILHVGSEDWPFPIPIVKQGNSWYFNTIEGREEILARRIGRNELETIQVCLAFVDAQREYASRDRTGDGVLQYAQKFVSDPGKKNGLYWPVMEGEELSPLGPLVAQASMEGYARKSGAGRPVAYHGYFYRILKEQGEYASGGARDYVAHGKMIGGFALVAYPAEYGNSGIMTFIVNQDGVVYQKDLGKKTAQIARAMKSFDPDRTWVRVQ